ncbi:Lrp/AsnC family transcriptional regulator, partial [Enterococcus faecalis]|uniref:Lrp/AsnC family transcriptional regulator n=1 Tax=Enterococcus faecalis TaxID=1351 RepID=UPI003D6C537D
WSTSRPNATPSGIIPSATGAARRTPARTSARRPGGDCGSGREEVGLAPPPCLRRVKRLEAEGVITGYRAVVDPRAAGRAFQVVVAV